MLKETVRGKSSAAGHLIECLLCTYLGYRDSMACWIRISLEHSGDNILASYIFFAFFNAGYQQFMVFFYNCM